MNARHVSLVMGTLALATLTLGVRPAAQGPRPLTLISLAEIPRVQDVQLSPDGRSVSYMLARADWKTGLLLTTIGILIMAPIIYFLGHNNASMQAYYKPFTAGLPWTTFLDLIGWEFFFRGWILFGYARKFGPEALWLQAVPFALAHLGKPEVETLTTIFGGFAFGWVAYRTRSFVWPFLIHWFIATFIIIVAAGLV